MIFFDAHAHVYPEYGMDLFFSSLLAEANRRAPGASCIAAAVMLRSFQHSLADVFASAGKCEEWSLDPPAATGAPWTARKRDGAQILLFPARQVAAAERLELLGYFGEALVPDGLPLKETARRLADSGFAVALAWGRGKWLLKRAKIVADFLSDPAMSAIAPFVCDCALRPWFWPEPLFALARKRGFRIISGSDPLPGKGNERNAGRKAMLLDAPPACSPDDLLQALNASDSSTK